MKKNLIIAAILFLSIGIAVLTRVYKLGEAPAGLYIDEAGQGYSAYSILKTGKDEFGEAFPIVFRSFTDFKTPVYIYLLVPLIPIFGLSAFTVRFPSFFFSILTIPLLYFLLKRISPKPIAVGISLLASFLLALSPWHILFGRTNFECNVALFFFLAGVYFFYRGLDKPKNLILSVILFSIAIPSYHSQRIITPLFSLLLFLRHRKKLLLSSHLKYLIAGLILGFIILLPTISVSLTPGFLARASGLNIFSWHRQAPWGYIPNLSQIVDLIVNNPIVLSTKEFLSLYFSYLSPRSMFALGDYGPRSSFPELSTFFLWQLPFYIAGLYALVKRKFDELSFFTIALLIISPIPAAITRDPYSTIRALPLVIPQIIIVSLGIHAFWQFLQKRVYKILALAGFFLIIFYSLGKLYSSVIILNEYYRASEWDYGWREVAQTISRLNPTLPVVVDTARDEPYISLLFFLKFDPATYQKDNVEVKLSEYYTDMNRLGVRKIGHIVTRPIDWKPDLKIKQYLVGDSLAISTQQIEVHGLTLIKEIYYPDGSPAFRIVQTNP